MEKKEREREKFREIEYKLIHRTETGIDKRIKKVCRQEEKFLLSRMVEKRGKKRWREDTGGCNLNTSGPREVLITRFSL